MTLNGSIPDEDKIRRQKAYTQIGLIVSQVNRVELELNELVVAYFVKEEMANEFSKEIMYGDKLSLHSKLKIAIFITEQLNISIDKKILEKWKNYRNIVAHGIPGYNTHSEESEVLYNGRPYSLNDTFKDFGSTHDKMIAMIKRVREKVER